MGSARSLITSFIMLIAIIFIGAYGYSFIEGWDYMDSVYMTVITIATVGYGEVHEVSRTGRIYTIFVIVGGVGFWVYVAGAAVQFMVEGRIMAIMGRRRVDKKISRMKNHYIVCGYGRIGRVLCNNLKTKPIDIIVVEKDESNIESMNDDDILFIMGDATDDENLIRAGIKDAKGLVAVLATDADNVYVVLTARQLNPNIHIIARAGGVKAKSKLLAAGADKVESPYEMGAASMAQRILRPTVTSFLDFAFARRRKDIQMEEIPVHSSSELVNIMLKDSGIRQRFNLIIIAIKKPDGTMLFNPSFEATIHGGDTVIAVGEEKNLQKLEKLLNPGGTW